MQNKQKSYTCLRPTSKPPLLSRSRSFRAPRNGHFRCSSSIARISAKSASETGTGR